MPLHGHVYTVPDGVRGFDTNQIVKADVASAFHNHGFRYCVRYVRRKEKNARDLSPGEAQSIIDAGAYDYAADAWGYTNGGAVEWTQSWWTLRQGFFDLSKSRTANI